MPTKKRSSDTDEEMMAKLRRIADDSVRAFSSTTSAALDPIKSAADSVGDNNGLQVKLLSHLKDIQNHLKELKAATKNLQKQEKAAQLSCAADAEAKARAATDRALAEISD